MPVIAQAPSGFRAETIRVALELLDDRQKVVRDRRRLRGLCVRVRREDVLAMTLRQIQQDAPQRQHALDHRQHQLTLLHPVHRHVDVVAGARGVEAARHVLAAARDDQPVDVEKEVLVRSVVSDAADRVHVDRVHRRTNRVPLRARHDPLLHQHHKMRVMDRHQGGEELRLRVLEVLVEHERDVVGGEGHNVRLWALGFGLWALGFG